ncbi:MAG: hypothetical protein ABJC09_03045 [Terriglobia bacterium]
MTIGGPGIELPSLDPRLLRAVALSLPDIAVSALPAVSGSPSDIVTPLPGDAATAALQFVLQTVDDRLAQNIAPGTAPIRTPDQNAQVATVNAALNHAALAGLYAHEGIAGQARTSAEESLAKAVHILATGEDRRVPEGVDPRAVVALATQFIETGQYLNFVRAGELARMVVSWHDPRIPAPGSRRLRSAQATPALTARSRPRRIAAVLWRRAPLLVLMAAWLAAGVGAGAAARVIDIRAWQMTAGVTVWATGFLGLVVFQFVATLRGYRPGRH